MKWLLVKTTVTLVLDKEGHLMTFECMVVVFVAFVTSRWKSWAWIWGEVSEQVSEQVRCLRRFSLTILNYGTHASLCGPFYQVLFSDNGCLWQSLQISSSSDSCIERHVVFSAAILLGFEDIGFHDSFENLKRWVTRHESYTTLINYFLPCVTSMCGIVCFLQTSLFDPTKCLCCKPCISECWFLLFSIHFFTTKDVFLMFLFVLNSLCQNRTSEESWLSKTYVYSNHVCFLNTHFFEVSFLLRFIVCCNSVSVTGVSSDLISKWKCTDSFDGSDIEVSQDFRGKLQTLLGCGITYSFSCWRLAFLL